MHPHTRAEWRSWLEANHAGPVGIWVITWRKGSGHEPLSYEDIVGQALCFGWVDSKKRGIDAARTMMWVSPRRPGSGWSRPNKERVARLEASGAMAAAGRQVIDAARADGSWNLLDDVEALIVPDDLALAFSDHPPAAAQWESFPPSAKRVILTWIMQAKRPQTRANRIDETARLAAKGERANQQ